MSPAGKQNSSSSGSLLFPFLSPFLSSLVLIRRMMKHMHACVSRGNYAYFFHAISSSNARSDGDVRVYGPVMRGQGEEEAARSREPAGFEDRSLGS